MIIVERVYRNDVLVSGDKWDPELVHPDNKDVDPTWIVKDDLRRLRASCPDWNILNFEFGDLESSITYRDTENQTIKYVYQKG